MSELTVPSLGFTDRRVLGTLAEKALTLTGEGYPLTVNSLVTGCNQKSNRDPVTDLADDEVEESLERLRKAGLVDKLLLSGSNRSEKFKHKLYAAWSISKTELAILTELLLRGSQTEGELRARASRMDDIADIEKLREQLKNLVERKMVVYLTPEGKRGTILTHGLYEPDELADERRRFAGGAVSDSPPTSRATGSSVSELQSQIADLKQQVERLTTEVRELQRIVNSTPKSGGV